MFAFLKQAIGDFTNTGAILPSSKHLATRMSASMRANSGARRVLEVGPGTGPFTRKILAELRPADVYHVVEINPAFCEHVERSLLQPHRHTNPTHSVSLHEAPIQDVSFDVPFDHIICGLPFNNFPLDLVELIFETMLGLLQPGGDLTYFEYAGVRRLKAPFVGDDERRRLVAIDSLASRLRDTYQGSRSLVLANVPPAFAIRLANPT